MLITTGGILVRTRVSEIREMGRATQGVTLINVDEGTQLSGLQRVAESDDEEDGDEFDSEEQTTSDQAVAADPAVSGNEGVEPENG
jgi:DNA gyrase subunit A